MVRGMDGLSPLKTTSFLCFQIIHIPRRHLALCACQLLVFPSFLIDHCSSDSFCLGSRSTLSVSRPMVDQICLPKTQSIIKCCMVSSCWLHNGHVSWWGSPRRASLSEVQHLFLIASQEKNRHRLGALVCQVNAAVGDTSLPMYRAAYAVRAENSPFCSHIHLTVSSISSASCTSTTLGQRFKNSSRASGGRSVPTSLAQLLFRVASATSLDWRTLFVTRL